MSSANCQKSELKLRILAQLKGTKSIDWKVINMPGRTVKSLQNQWTKYVKEMEALDIGTPSGETTPKKTPAKGTSDLSL